MSMRKTWGTVLFSLLIFLQLGAVLHPGWRGSQVLFKGMLRLVRVAIVVMGLTAGISGWAQGPLSSDNPSLASQAGVVLPVSVSPPAARPRMSPELALDTYEKRMRTQAAELAAYSDTTLMTAELTDTKQHAAYELTRQYAAPGSLQFTPLAFQGDTFVKSNVMLRLLQAEVDHVTRRQLGQTAISQENYKFSLKAVDEVDGHNCYVFQVKPRKKRVGLFKGKAYIDSYTGTLRRAEGSIVKSPSWWIKKIEFVQDFDDVGNFILPVRLHSVNRVRVLGRTVVDIAHTNYRATAAVMKTALGGGGSSAPN